MNKKYLQIIVLQIIFFALTWALAPNSAYFIGDARQYQLIAQMFQSGDYTYIHGPNGAYFPGYSFLISLFLPLFSDPLVIGLLINFLATTLAAIILLKLTKSMRLAIILLVFPQMILYNHSIYKEALFLLMEMAVIYLIATKKYFSAIAIAALSMFVSSQGILMAFGTAILVLASNKIKSKHLVLIPLIGLGLMVAYFAFFTGDPAKFLTATVNPKYSWQTIPITPGAVFTIGLSLALILLTLFKVGKEFMREKTPQTWFNAAFLFPLAAITIYTGIKNPMFMFPGQIDRFYLAFLPLTLILYQKEIEKHFILLAGLCVIGSVALAYGWWF